MSVVGARGDRLRRLRALLAAIAIGVAAGMAASVTAGDADIEVFVKEGCPHCERAERFLERLAREHPGITFRVLDIGRDGAAATRLAGLAKATGVRALGLPAFHVNGELIVGFGSDDTTGAAILAAMGERKRSSREDFAVEVPLVGTLSLRVVGLPLFTVALGLIDGFNPCAMWALLLVLSLLVNLESRTKMLVLGGAFVGVAGVVYFAFMAAWLEVFRAIGASRLLQVVLGTVALLAGAINLMDSANLGARLRLRIPESAKPRVYAGARRVLTAENLPAALLAIVVLSLTVNVVELACTAGLPALYTQVLATRALPRWQYYGYLGLYNVAYILDDAVMLATAVITLDRRKLGSLGARRLKLLSGAVMVGLGLLLIAAPRWLF